MKKSFRLMAAIICILSTLALMSLTLFAEGQTVKQGWSYDEDGKERYYVNGVPVKGTHRVGVHDYLFDEVDGAYIGGLDTYTNPGTVGVMDTEAYVSAINALGSDVLLRETFNVGRPYGSKNNLNNVIGEIGIAPTTKTSSSIYYSNGFRTMVQQATYSIARKSEGSDPENLSYTYQHTHEFNPSVLSSTGLAHTYMDKASLNMSSGKIVIEFEVKLTNLPSTNTNLIHVGQRYDKDGDGSANDLLSTQLLSVNTEGYVYANREQSKLICNIYQEEFTRLSVVCDVEANTYDVYCNGILMLEGIRTYSDRGEGMPSFQINETRMFQINAVSTEVPNSCAISVDNIYIYKANDIVCRDTTTQLKNGVATEGAYLRYYHNGSICTGKYAVTGQYFSQTLNGQFFDFDSKNGRAFVGFKSTVVNGGATVSSEFMDGNVYVSPKAVDISGKKFVGWKVTVGDGAPFLGVNNSFHAESSVTSEAMGVEFAMLSGASLKTVANTSELRYIAKIAKSDYDALTSLGASVEPHIIIAPTSVVERAYGYTDYETLLAMSGDEQILDIKADSWYTQTDNYYYYTASVGNITDYLKEYSAIAYLKITLPDGTAVTVRADYSAENNSRSVYYVASRAYNDRTTLENQDGYGVRIKFNRDDTFSPYSAERLGVIKKFVDAIVSLSTNESKVESSGRFYNAPYEVDCDEIDTGYNVTLKKTDKKWSLSNVSTLMVDGNVLSSEQYSVKSDKIQLTLDTKKVQLKTNYMESAGSSIRLVEVTSEKSIFPKSVTFETLQIPNAPDGSTDGAVWSYDGNKKLTSAKGFEAVKSNGYYDLTKYNSFVFYVYVQKESIGETFLIHFSSENSSTEKTDYYSKKFEFKHEGWTQIIANKDELVPSQEPLGWDKIDAVSFIISGWNQTNSNKTQLYITDVIAYEKAIVTRDSSLEFLTKDGGAAFAVGGYAAVINGKYNPINPSDIETVVFEDDGKLYLPVNSFALAKDENACFYSGSKIVTYTEDGKDYVFRAGENKYRVGKSKVKLENKLIGRDGAVYMAAEDAMTVFGYTQMFRDQMGLIVLSNKENILDSEKDRDTIFEAIQDLLYVRPLGEQVVSDMQEYSGAVHPYLMVGKKDFEELSYYAKNEALLQSYITKLEESYGIGSSNFNAAPNTFKLPDERRLLNVSRDVMKKTLNWALLYKLGDYTDEQRRLIRERIWAEVYSAANFFDERIQKYSWNSEHFLDTAELAYPMAIMYDWLYDDWTPEQRGIIAKAIYDLALKQTSVLVGEYEYSLGGSSNNWNGVCNGGIMAGALAIVNDEYIVSNNLRDDVIAVIGASIKGVEKGMWVYAPDGGYEEGPGYWAYGTTYLHVFMSCLNSACGTNYGLYDSPGFEKSVYFTTYLANANTTWGFHDGGSGANFPDTAAWFARMSGDGSINAIKREAIEKGWCGVGVYDVMWFSPHIITNSISLTLDAYYSLDATMTFRSSWDSSNNIFVGLHGGSNSASHGDLDIGNFVINVNGTYMICDLGSDNYNMQGYFGDHRWSYYRKRTEGQNTLVMIGHGVSWDGKTGSPQTAVINPQTGKPYVNEAGRVTKWTVGEKPDSLYYGQKYNAVSNAVAFKSGVSSAYGIIDMAPAYYSVEDGTNMWRGIWFKDNRSTVVLQDEGEFTSKKDIWWFAHTEGKITIIGDGKSAYIYRNGIYLYAEIVTDPNNPMDAKFTEMKAVSLDNDYVGDTVFATDFADSTERSRDSISKLTIAVENYDVCNIAVVFKVINSPEDIPEFGTTYAWTPMSQWTAE